jgi:16S rRNA (uracil1498-N3)-methyltransferase
MGWLLANKTGNLNLKRYWTDQPCNINEALEITGDLFHHIVDVCRHQMGDKIELITSDGFAFLSELVLIKKKSLTMMPLEKRKIPDLPRPHLILYLSFPKFQTFEAVIEKAVELGVTSIQPFFSEFSFIKSEGKISEEKWARWNRIIVTATQQSNRGDFMKIEQPLQWSEVIEKLKFNPDDRNFCLFSYEGTGAVPISQIFNKVTPPLAQREEIHVLVGSEGGFSAQEATQIAEMNIQVCNLGQQILRVETACMALLGILKYESRVI